MPLNSHTEFEIALARRVSAAIDEPLCERVAQSVIDESAFEQGYLSIAIVDNAEIHELNRTYLDHDYPTDVLSFPLNIISAEKHLEGEIIVSHEMAVSQAETPWLGCGP